MDDCCMYNKTGNKCRALKKLECDDCAFYKTNREYIQQTGKSYERVMRRMKLWEESEGVDENIKS